MRCDFSVSIAAMPLLARHRAGAFASVIALVVLVLARTSASWQQPTSSSLPTPVAPSGISDEEVQKIICAQCHKPPAPEILPRSKWHHEIAKMMYLRDK